MSDISVEERKATPIAEQAAEFVERKGIGHPDSLIDGIVEKVSFELGKAYRENAGFVLHHNVDKGLIIGGTSEVGFGYGKIVTPIEVIIAGRATKFYNGKEIDVDNIAISAARNYLKEHTRFLDVDKEVRFYSKILKGSSDLNSIFARSQDIPLANDTSLGIGFAPLTETERLTLETERFLNSAEYKKKMPSVGEDIKVMGIRDGDRILLTVAIAFVAQFVKSIDEYIAIKEKVAKDILKKASSITSKETNIVINNGDSHKDKSVYLTKSGLSCESGDDGSVGRGNRVNGLIRTLFHNNSKMSIAEIAKVTKSNVDLLWPQINAADFLGLVKITDENVELTKLGKEMHANSDKAIAEVGKRLKSVEPFKTAYRLSVEKGKFSTEDLSETLMNKGIIYMANPSENAAAISVLLFQWAIYFNIIDYDGKQRMWMKED